MTFGSYFFVYVGQIACDAQHSVALTWLWFLALVLSLITKYIIAGLGVAGTFALFGISSLLGGLYLLNKMKETDGLSPNAKKQLFFPEEFKTPTEKTSQHNTLNESFLEQ